MWNLAALRAHQSLALSLVLCGAVAAVGCASDDTSPVPGNAGSSGSGGSNASGSGGTGGSSGSGSSGSGGSGGDAGSDSSGGSSGSSGSGGATGGSAGSGGAGGGTGGSAGSGGAGGATGGSSGSAGSDAGAGGTAGSSGADGGVSAEAGRPEGGGGGGCGTTNKAVSFNKNVEGRSDMAKAHVEVDFGASTDLPTGNTKRTIEFWAYVLQNSWAADANTLFFYGTNQRKADGFGLDFGTPGTIDPFTNAIFDNDNQPSGLSASTSQWAHFAMTWDGTSVRAFVNGVQKAIKASTGAQTTLMTGTSPLTIGGYNMDFFNGYIDEFRVWNMNRTAAEITSTMTTPLVGNEAGLTAYYRFDDGTGATAADSVTSAGHTAHNGTLKANSAANLPTWVAGAPLVCP